jgi:leader peptidase (prepilin peptidase)/N-methyltransferase
MIAILVFIFGLIIGSFLNAVIFRLYKKESIVWDRSHCVFCNHDLAAKDLIPLFSFLFLRGRCRYCSRKISWQYPLIESVTAILFVLLFLHNGSIVNINLIFSGVFASFLIVIGVFDFKHYLILDKVVFPALALAIVWNLIQHQFISGLLAGFIAAGFFGIQYAVSSGRWIGFGDVKLGLFLGNLLGLKFTIAMLFFAYFVGAIIGVGLIIFGKKKLSSKLPFGVFLSLSTLVMMLYGEPLVSWYLKLIGAG